MTGGIYFLSAIIDAGFHALLCAVILTDYYQNGGLTMEARAERQFLGQGATITVIVIVVAGMLSALSAIWGQV